MGARAKETPLRFHKERRLRVLVEIQPRLDEPLRLEELASLACLSPHHLAVCNSSRPRDAGCY